MKVVELNPAFIVTESHTEIIDGRVVEVITGLRLLSASVKPECLPDSIRENLKANR